MLVKNLEFHFLYMLNLTGNHYLDVDSRIAQEWKVGYKKAIAYYLIESLMSFQG